MIELNRENTNIEIKLLLEAIFLKYGYDFRNYGQAHLKRRIDHRLMVSGIKSISELTQKVLYEQDIFNLLLLDLSINVTEMFRDPGFYKTVREKIIPALKTFPFIKIWHAGCSTGEEVYSMAILLKEEGLIDKAQIYATDFNQIVLKKAKEGIYPINMIPDFTSNYQRSGGKNSFADYYKAKYNSVMIDPALRQNIVFADHNLVLDGVFGEMHMIVCRNVLIYFDRILQERVIKLFIDSLTRGGYLCLGSKETLRFTRHFDHFSEVEKNEKIYKKLASLEENVRSK
ncbi:MAG: protein-glutamate O-methyltransferase CheR [Bacteroidales bacterium]|nr:protein-glutamate O-methyltransferase CheR [Bacteroidales bacterium]MCF8403672.1 protein-glutamate O-methyltransferase CheR [Bacteroidales bacterium]